ncbi:tRNA (guanosine(37)-N1)-methyltransferase TrmD [Rhodobacteraceae bacterium]|nr:tRNA (guanosine(37)-N1)-methyltransferase TrmD [Paracoccaceae bacterium]
MSADKPLPSHGQFSHGPRLNADGTGAAAGKSHGRLSISASRQPRSLMDDAPQLVGAWKAKIVTLFPEAFPGTLGLSLLGRARDQGLWALDTIDLRPFGVGKHKNVDDTPAGGGAGMVMRADVVGAALKEAARGVDPQANWPVLYMSPRGKPFNQAMARRFAACDGVTILCGRFEGVDERVLEHYGVEEVSMGDFVLTGGEIPAQTLIDATVRLLPGVLGNAESAVEESHSAGLLEHPQYTRPAEWEGRTVPDVLTSGHHGRIAEWRREMSEEITARRRPDLWAEHEKNTPAKPARKRR